MNTTRRLCCAFALALAATLPVQAGDVYRYDWLAATNLPAPSKLVEAAMKALPKTVREKQDWLARMRKAAWIPTVELHYTLGEGIYRDYQVVNRVQHTSGSELQRESGRSSDSSSSRRSGSSTQVDTDALNAPAGGNTSTSTEDTRGRSSSTDQRTTRISSESTTYAGPESYATGERTRWLDEFGLYVSWDLSRVLFREEEISVVGAELDKASFRQDVKAQVIDNYYSLVETLLLLDSATYRESVPTRVKRERLAYLLDSLTDGALSNAGGREAP